MTSETWNDYWNASSNSGFNFDYNEVTVYFSKILICNIQFLGVGTSE